MSRTEVRAIAEEGGTNQGKRSKSNKRYKQLEPVNAEVRTKKTEEEKSHRS